MTVSTSASSLTQILGEVAEGQLTMSGQLAQISEACLEWAQAFPDQFRVSYDRFEKARQAVRLEPTSEDWAELKESAQKLGEDFWTAS